MTYISIYIQIEIQILQFLVPPLSVSLLRTELPLVAGQPRTVECRVRQRQRQRQRQIQRQRQRQKLWVREEEHQRN